MIRKWTAVFLAACLLLAALTGCGAGQGERRDGKVLVFGDTTFNAENSIPDLHPHHENSGWACIRYGIGETLFRYTDTMEIEPWLAEKAELTDPCTWKITLKDNVTFSNGKAVDAQAVKACLEALTAVHRRACSDLQIASMEADGLVLTIRTKRPVPALLHYLSDPYGCIIDVCDGSAGGGMATGTGPYRAVSFVSGRGAELVKNEAYWNGTPKLDALSVRTIAGGHTMAMALQSGEIDAAYGLPYASYALFRNDGYCISSAATSRAFFLQMNFDSPVIQDKAVRKAIAMAVDKSGFVRTLLDGNGYEAEGPFPDAFAFGNSAVQAKPYDLNGAAKVLEEAGWRDSDGDGIREKDGKKLEIRWLTYPSRQELPLLAELVQASLKKIGIAAEINCTAVHNGIRRDRTAWDVYAASMVTAPAGDPQYFFTSCCLDGSEGNNGNYHSDRLEDLAAQMGQTFDEEKRRSLAAEMAQVLLDDDAYIFCSHLKMSIVTKANVEGLSAHPCDFYEITVQTDKR